MIKINKTTVTLATALTVGLAQEIGRSVSKEGYKVFEAIDPLYDFRRKLEEKKRKKMFKDIMSQIDLKAELT